MATNACWSYLQDRQAFSFCGVCMNIEPVERLIIEGLSRKFSSAFSCKQTLVTSAYEKSRLLANRKSGTALTYPMAFLKITGISAAPDRYVSPYLARTGTQIVASDDD